jgi:lipoteichoic acid synthase
MMPFMNKIIKKEVNKLLHISQQKKHWIYMTLLLGMVTLCWALKTLYFVHELELSPHKKLILLSSTGFGLIITALFFGRKSKLNSFSAFILYVIFSLLLYADVVYERYYDAILHIELADQANQLGDVMDSVVTLIYKTDIWYWIDIPILAILFVIVYKNFNKGNRLIQTGFIIGTGTIFIFFAAFFPLKPTFSDQYKVSLTGIIPTHIFDLSSLFYGKVLAQEATSQQQDILNTLKSEFEQKHKIQKQSPNFGKYKGKNVIMVQAESLNTFPIGMKVNGQEITPNLNKLIKTSDYYPNTYLQIGRGNTSDAEFVANNSIYPIAEKGIYKTFPNNRYLSLAKVLKREGYSTSVTHGNSPEFWNRQVAYRKQSYDIFYHINHPEIDDSEIIGLGISDESIFKQMANIYEETKKPFYNFIVSLTNHRPFELPKEYQYLTLPKEFENTSSGNYLQSVHYFDKALGTFIEELKKKNLWNDTIFVVYGDHYGPIPKDERELKQLLNITFDEKTRFNIPLIIHKPGQKEGYVNHITASQMDIFPTLTTLLGIDYPLVQFGESLDMKKDGFAGFAYETTKYSFYTDNFDYIASHDGVFESGTCIDNKTKKTTNIEACRKGYNKLFKDIESSKFLLENNKIRNVFEDGEI